MGDALPLPPPGFEGLSTEEKIEHVQALWDHISSDVERVPLTEWQKKLLDERLDDGSRLLAGEEETGIPRLGERGDDEDDESEQLPAADDVPVPEPAGLLRDDLHRPQRAGEDL